VCAFLLFACKQGIVSCFLLNGPLPQACNGPWCITRAHYSTRMFVVLPLHMPNQWKDTKAEPDSKKNEVL
jgi:hypothetical protein